MIHLELNDELRPSGLRRGCGGKWAERHHSGVDLGGALPSLAPGLTGTRLNLGSTGSSR